jgi:multidrug efflux pump subunit AcrB
LIVDPIEEAINELEDIKDIKSIARDGLAYIAIEFLSGSDPNDKYSDVVQKVNRTRNQLPNEIASIDINKWTITDVQILQLALSSDSASYRLLEDESERLGKILKRISGVQKVKTWAFPEQEVRISLDLEKIAPYYLSLGHVINAIKASNANIPGGNVDIGTRRFNILTSGSYESISDIENTVIHAANGKVVYLKDIGSVRQVNEDFSYIARFKDKRAVFISLSQKEGTNIINVMADIKEKLSRFRSQLPNGIEMEIVLDQSESVADRLNGFFINLLQGLVLVGLVIFSTIGFRASIIVILAIPISLMIGIGFVDMSNYGLQQMTISGMVIALGLLVDNAIVVIENISRFLKLGYSRTEAAVKGTSQIAWAIVSATATTVLAFVPMMMMKNITGDFIRSMPLTVVFTLSASLLVSLLLTPYLSKKYLKVENDNPETRVRQLLNRFISTHYRQFLNFALLKPKRMLLLVVLILIMSLSLFPLIGVSFFPKAEKPQFIINIDLPEGASFDRTAEVTRDIETELKNHTEIDHFATNIGHGNPRIYYNVIPKNNASNHAQIIVKLHKYEVDAFDNLIKDLRHKFSMYPGADIEVKEFEQGPPVEAPIAIRILGDNLDILKRIARDVEDVMANTSGTVNIKNPLTTSKIDIQVDINRSKAAMLGIPLVEIDRTVRACMKGLSISKYRDPSGKEYDIVIRLPLKDKIRYSDFDKIYVSSVKGTQVPLRHVASINFNASPQEINHFNLERSVTLTSDVRSDISVNQTTLSILEKLDNYHWPKGYRYGVGGALESREESFGGMMQAVIVALIGIFAVLVLQFRSYTQPLIVFSAIPLALIGSFIALLITGNTFSFTAFIGLTSLLGIVINNSIILVDYTNQLHRSGKNIIAALKEAGETRFMPIVLTTATTVGGLLPLTLRGGTLWAPMGWTIIGGLIVSTFLTLIVVPVLYKLYSPSQ